MLRPRLSSDGDRSEPRSCLLVQIYGEAGSDARRRWLQHQGSCRFVPNDVIFHGPNPFG